MPSPARSRLKDATESTPTLDDYRRPGWTATSFLGVGIFTTWARLRWCCAAVLEAGPGRQSGAVASSPIPESCNGPARWAAGPRRLCGECRCKESSPCQRHNAYPCRRVPRAPPSALSATTTVEHRQPSGSVPPSTAQDLRRRSAMIGRRPSARPAMVASGCSGMRRDGEWWSARVGAMIGRRRDGVAIQLAGILPAMKRIAEIYREIRRKTVECPVGRRISGPVCPVGGGAPEVQHHEEKGHEALFRARRLLALATYRVTRSRADIRPGKRRPESQEAEEWH